MVAGMEVPPNSCRREGVANIDLGRRNPWWSGRREEGVASPLKKSV